MFFSALRAATNVLHAHSRSTMRKLEPKTLLLIAGLIALLRWLARLLKLTSAKHVRDRSSGFQRQKFGEEEQNEYYTRLIIAITTTSVFKSIDPAEYGRLAEHFASQTFAPGEKVEVEQENTFFVIEDGEVITEEEDAFSPPDSPTAQFRRQISDGPQEDRPTWGGSVGSGLSSWASENSRRLQPGDFFGEESFVSDAPPIEARAETELTVWFLPRAVFDSLGLQSRRAKSKRKAVRDDNMTEEEHCVNAASTPKTQDEIDFVRESMLRNPKIGSLFASIRGPNLERMVSRACRMTVQKGQDVIVQGDTKADLFYIIAKGNCDFIVDGDIVNQLGPGGSFGEMALLLRCARQATARASEDLELWAVHRVYLSQIFREKLESKLEAYAALLRPLDLFKDKHEKSIAQLADALVETTFYKDEYIIHQGEEAGTCYILYDGQVVIETDGIQITTLRAEPGASNAQVFGERALLTGGPQCASVKTAGRKATVLALCRGVFSHIMQGSRCEPRGVSTSDYVAHRREDLEDIALLGYGGFGAVTLVRNAAGQTFALKALSKGNLIETKTQNTVLNEKAIFRSTHSPFLVRLAATFNSKQFLYFLLEPALGGDLLTVYQRKKFSGSSEHARFYIACVVRAFQHLHSRHIIYRDLKPENLMLDSRGYCKVTDFGLSKFVLGYTYTSCGTPAFFAPEMISGGGYTKAIDWWALGAMTYEFMTGTQCFEAASPEETLMKVKRGIRRVRFPVRAGPWAQFVKDFCVIRPSERLPMQKNGIQKVEEHEWYTTPGNSKVFDWHALKNGTMAAPFLPKVRHAEDVHNFDLNEQCRPPETWYTDPGDGWDDHFEDVMGPPRFEVWEQ